MDSMELLLEAYKYSEEINKLFLQEYQNIIHEYDLSTKQSLVLQYLKDAEKLTMQEVAQILAATPSAASQLIKTLEEKNYVRREVNKDNRRETFVFLDKKGIEFFNKLDQTDQYVLGKYFMKLPAEDIVTYHRVLKKLLEIVKEVG